MVSALQDSLQDSQQSVLKWQGNKQQQQQQKIDEYGLKAKMRRCLRKLIRKEILSSEIK